MNFKIAMQKPRHLLHSQLGATFVEGAIAFGVVAVIAGIVIYSISPKLSNYSARSQIAEAVQLAAGFPLSLGNLSAPGADPEPGAATLSLQSFANLVAGNSVPTCAYLIETKGDISSPGCPVATSHYSSISPQGSDNAGTCPSSPPTLAVDKVERLAKTECLSRAFFGVTSPQDLSLATSPVLFAVQKGASINSVGLALGE